MFQKRANKKSERPAKTKETGTGIRSKLQKRDTRENIQYYLMMCIPLVLIFIFSYLPMFGIVIAFQDYIAGRPFFGDGVKWVGLKWFKEFITSYYFPRILRNTLVLNAMNLLLGFCVPIFFSLLVNEIRLGKFKKFTQTVSYLPYFLSAVVVAGMVVNFLANDGVITKLLQAIGFETKSIITNANAFPWIYTLTSIWKNFGWSSIIYLSTISAIDPQLYEAAAVDGAGRIRKIWHVTIPAMMPLIVIQLIMSIGSMLSANTELILLLYSSSTYKTADVIGTYVYRESLMRGKYSYGTASGLFMSILSFLLTYVANSISRKKTDYSMW